MFRKSGRYDHGSPPHHHAPPLGPEQALRARAPVEACHANRHSAAGVAVAGNQVAYERFGKLRNTGVDSFVADNESGDGDGTMVSVAGTKPNFVVVPDPG